MSSTSLAPSVLRLLVATLKGGPAKTTTSVMLSFYFARRGYRVVLIDADTRTQGTTDWKNLMLADQRAGGEPVPEDLVILSWRGSDLDGKLSKYAQAAEAQYSADVVIIDTGGEAPDVFMSAALYADRLLSPVGPKKGELRRMYATSEAAAEIAESSPLLMSVVLTRVHPSAIGKGAAAEARDFLRYDLDLYVQETEIPDVASRYGDIWGTVPLNLGVYEKLGAEIESNWK